VRSADYDKDGDLDLFVAGRVDPWNYPRPVTSFLYRNDTKSGQIRFTDVTSEVIADMVGIGLVCDALFTDFDNDGWPDLMLCGEWMPITLMKNEKGNFKRLITPGINDRIGWWNSIAPGDFDRDGDMDYIVGNLGLNSFYSASDIHPVSVYASDFDNNGSYDAFPSIYLPASQEDTTRKEFPVHMRDDAVKQMISLRSRFQNYKSYAIATIDQLFSPEQFSKSLKVKANYLQSSYCRNDGDGRFTLIPLPAQAQFSVLNGMQVDDFDGDGNLDVLISANDYGTEVTVGRYDALNGLVLKGDGKGGFKAQSMAESGIFIPGNGKGLAALIGNDGRYMVVAGQNRGPLKLFEQRKRTRLIRAKGDEVSADIHYRNGATRRTELYYGSSFLSQSARFLSIDEDITRIIIWNGKGEKKRNCQSVNIGK